MEYTITREEAISELICQNMFREFDILDFNPASEFYIKHRMDGYEYFDVDRAAWLNTLFQYDIGIENALKIDDYLWNMEDEIETLEVTFKDKALIKKASTEMGLNLDFSNWRTDDPATYHYYNEKGEEIA